MSVTWLGPNRNCSYTLFRLKWTLASLAFLRVKVFRCCSRFDSCYSHLSTLLLMKWASEWRTERWIILGRRRNCEPMRSGGTPLWWFRQATVTGFGVCVYLACVGRIVFYCNAMSSIRQITKKKHTNMQEISCLTTILQTFFFSLPKRRKK